MLLNGLVREVLGERFPPKKVLIRVDAGRVKGLSFGHVSRCMIIAAELRRAAGSSIIFVMRDYSEGVKYARASGFMVKTLDAYISKKAHDNRVKALLSDLRPDCMVFDLPFDDPSDYLEYARRNNVFTVCIDDAAERDFHADVILNSSILADRSAYGECLPSTRFLLGMNYFIMNDNAVKTVPDSKKKRFSALLTFGGSDITGLTLKAMKTLATASLGNAVFTVALGPGFKEKRAVIDAARPFKEKMKVISNPRSLRKYFINSDLVICAGGTTLYELCKMAIPCIAIASTEHEARVIEKFAEKGLILSGLKRWDKKEFVNRIEHVISTLSGEMA